MRTYNTKWRDGLVHSTLVIEEANGGQAVVADVWFDGDELSGAVAVHWKISVNGEARRLDDEVAASNDIDEAKGLVEKWLVETWGLEQAYERLTGVWI